jgi:hypothetical protein
MSVDSIKGIYREMGLPTPEVIKYPALHLALADRQSWWPRVKGIVPVLWDYQYPVLHPDGYWAQYHLFDTGFQFDITRTANAHGCYLYPTYLSQIPIQAKFLYSRYLMAVIEAYRERSPTPVDTAILQVMDSEASFLEEIQNRRDQEDPTDQAPLEGHLFLGAQSWIAVEFTLLRAMREWIQRPVCEQHYQHVKLLHEHTGVFITFGNLVVATER